MVLVEEAMGGSGSSGHGALGLGGGARRGDGVDAAHAVCWSVGLAGWVIWDLGLFRMSLDGAFAYVASPRWII